MFYAAIILGLVGSFHCVGMCGAIAFMLPIDRSDRFRQHLQIMLYHLGRLSSYGLIGLVFGILGRGFVLFDFQQYLSVFMGVLMILFGIVPSFFKGLDHIPVLARLLIRVKSGLGKELKKKNNETFFAIGFINGFLPCGVLYAAIFGAIATHDLGSAILYMVLFGIGTIPLMTAVVYFGNSLNLAFRKRILKFIPVTVVLIGLLFVIRGLGMGNSLSPSVIVSNLVEFSSRCFY